MRHTVQWQPHYIAYMKRLIDQEISASEVAKRMSRHFKRSFTAHAVRTKARREGLTLQYKPAGYNRLWRNKPEYLWQVEVNKVVQQAWR